MVRPAVKRPNYQDYLVRISDRSPKLLVALPEIDQFNGAVGELIHLCFPGICCPSLSPRLWRTTATLFRFNPNVIRPRIDTQRAYDLMFMLCGSTVRLIVF